MLAVAWLKSFVPAEQMRARIDAAKQNLMLARERMRQGESAPLYDPKDTAAWYILQAETFATDRAHWTPEGVLQSVPFLTRIGQELPLLLTVGGGEERAARVMLNERSQPDGGIFELLVSLAYRRGGWGRVEFVPETPGCGPTPDLHVFRKGSRWAVECKRMAPSPYAAREKTIGDRLAGPVHAFCLETDKAIVVEVKYKIELDDVPDSYLFERVKAVTSRGTIGAWDDDISAGRTRPVDWPLVRQVMSKDDVYFGASRMIELLVGYFVHEAAYSLEAKWRPAALRPEYASAIYHASVVSWVSRAEQAVRRKARHFRKMLAEAERQLPDDRPGVLHVGIESSAGAAVDYARHISNQFQTRSFSLSKSRLRWVYGNYFAPERTTRFDETWAIDETMVPYRVGSHRTPWPLPGHLLVSPEGVSRAGVHWN
jgi:hypothetical protein